MLNTEATFRNMLPSLGVIRLLGNLYGDEFFTPDPQITEYKKNLIHNYSNGYLVEYTIEKKFLFIKRKYSTYKPGYYMFYTRNFRRDLRVEEWIEIKKDDLRPYRFVSVKNGILEGEALQFIWE